MNLFSPQKRMYNFLKNHIFQGIDVLVQEQRLLVQNGA